MKLLAGDLIRLIETPKEHAKDTLERLGGIEAIAVALNTSLEEGLDGGNDADLQQRLEIYGVNYVEPENPATIFLLMWQAFQDLTLMVLTAAGILSTILSYSVGHHPDTAWIEGATILFAVFIVVLVTALNDYQKEKQFRALNAIKEDEMIKVIRNGRPCEVSKFKLVVGDIVRVDLGDIIPADGLVFDENDLKLDESAMTGESDLLPKNHLNAPFLLSGTKVMEGVGKMLVVCVGESSQSGIISKLIMGKKVTTNTDSDNSQEQVYIAVETPREGEPTPTKDKKESSKDDDDDDDEVVSPLQGKLNSLTLLIGKLGTLTAIIVFVGMSVRFSIETFGVKSLPWSKVYLKDYLDFFIVAITVLVVAIPEGLPLAVTISLAYSVKKMLQDNNLVRHLDACETMGSATTICSDKTGTLTTNRMTVMKCFMDNDEFSNANELLASPALSDATKHLFANCVAVNSTAEILPPLREGAQPEHTGNKTECALLQFVTNMGLEYSNLRKQNHIGRMITFSSAKKRMSVVIPLGNLKYRVFTKGASEIVLGLCNNVLNLNGTVSTLTAERKQQLLDDVIEKYASGGYRTLCLAYRDIGYGESDISQLSDDEIEADLTLVALVGIEDPVREEVPASIECCKQAGIVVRMVTGDNLSTAKSIALKCGIINANDGSLVMEGSEFRRRVLDSNGDIIQSEFDKIWPMLRVLARSSPKDKYTLVSGLISSNLFPHGPQVVAVTGDGTNDAPALKKADVGFAMGICGTAVAKDASDIILMDDNFTSIVNAVKWGRNVYDSISKFLQFQLTVNVVAITTAVICAIAIRESPLTAVQLLWVNLIMDTFASLALATEAPTPHLLERKPYPRTKPLLSKTMTKHIIGQSILQLIIVLTLTFSPTNLLNVPSGMKKDLPDGSEKLPSEHFTIIFNTFVFLQLFNELNARRIHDEINIFTGLMTNHVFIGVGIFQVLAQILIVQYGGRAFGCTPLSGNQWLICILLGALSLPMGLLLRMVHSSMLPNWFAAGKSTAPTAKLTSKRSQELWIRGISRLRTQMRVICAFKKGLQNNKKTLGYSPV